MCREDQGEIFPGRHRRIQQTSGALYEVKYHRSDGASAALEDQIREKEGARILAKLPQDALIVTLEIAGKNFSSEEFAAWIEDCTVRGKSHICFVIGGSLGLHPSVCKRADLALSFSKMTFPHQLMRVILCEQIYRAFRIIQHEPYHK